MNQNELNTLPDVIREQYSNIYYSCLRRLDNNQPRDEAIKKSVEQMLKQLEDEDYTFSDIETIKEKLMKLLDEELSHSVTFDEKKEEPCEILSSKARQSHWWSDIKKQNVMVSSGGSYWKRYSEYLFRNKGRLHEDIKCNIDDPTDSLMNRLLNPNDHVKNSSIGLVFGHVQSGKTAHYIGLINKAIDAGYTYIVVLAGIHNNLRSQTQTRIDKEVLGLITDTDIIKARKNTDNISLIQGVGEIDSRVRKLTYLTSSDENGDINKHDLKQENLPAFAVVKKNKNSLSDLQTFFRIQTIALEENRKTPHYGPKYSLLMIDDEADQASLNTKDCYDKNGEINDDYKPTVINQKIREILELFDVSSYVGYTATPFANIFADPDVQPPDAAYGPILFPKDFIVTIPRSPEYIGAREFFGWKETCTDTTQMAKSRSMPLVRFIDANDDNYFNCEENQKTFNTEMLKEALLSFLISTACRKCRGQKYEPNSMLVHIDRKIESQKIIYQNVVDLWKNICIFIKNNDREIKSNLQRLWNDDYLRSTENMKHNFASYMKDVPNIAWDDIWAEIKRLTNIDPNTYDANDDSNLIKLYKINGSSADALRYEDMKGQEYNVIAIGGDKLSRGLTLDGLTVSYFSRESKTYDTLMQMGRWFGYRKGYVDLCRLYLPQTLYNDFQDISIATDDLVEQFKQFDKDQTKKPEDVGLSVIKNPNLLICSKNKMKGFESIRGSFSGEFSQSQLVDVDAEKYRNNFLATEKLIQKCDELKSCEILTEYRKRKGIQGSRADHLIWDEIPGDYILQFFSQYKTSKHAGSISSENISRYITAQLLGANELNCWTVCLKDIGKCKDISIAGHKIGHGKSKKSNNLSAKLSDDGSYYDLRAISPGDDEYIDYDAIQLKKVEEIKDKIKAGILPVSSKKISKYIRKETRSPNNGLLILTPIDLDTYFDLKKCHGKITYPPIGFTLVFPESKNLVKLPERILNKVGVKLRHKDE